MPKLTSEQKAALRQRIDQVVGFHPRALAGAAARLPDTPPVKRARALIKRFDGENSKRIDKAQQKYRIAYEKTRTVLLFSDPPGALAAVEALEKCFAPKPAKKAVRHA